MASRPEFPETVVSFCLEFARAEDSGDPYAFRFARQKYLLRTPAGGFESAEFSWDEALLTDLTALRQPGRDPTLPPKIGELLRQFLAPMGWSEEESRLLRAVKAGQKLLLTIRSAAAEIYALPWELLTLKSTGQHVGELPGLQLRYEWPATDTAPQTTHGTAPGRILFAWSAAAGEVPAAEHLGALQAACQAGAHPFDPERDVLPHVTCGRLSRVLAAAQQSDEPIAVLQILCHGAQSGSTFGLAFDPDEAGTSSVVVDPARMRQLLAPYAGMVRLVVLAVCDGSNSGALGNQLGSVAQTLHRAGFAAVVASRYPLSVSGSIRLTEALYQGLLLVPSSLEQALVAARQRLAEDAAQFDWAALQLYARLEDGNDTRPLVIRPYRGLLAFQPEHGRFFFGREREIGEILDRMRQLVQKGAPRLLVIAGASGTGKSSVVLAGVVPRVLAASGGIRLVRMRPGADPLGTLEGLLPQDASIRVAPGWSEGLLVGPGQSASFRLAPSFEGTLLIIDQLEEIFTHLDSGAARSAFIQRLWQLASSTSSRVLSLLTLRIDFIGRCGELSLDGSGRRFDSVAYDEKHRVFIGQLGADSLRQAIEEPARKVGLMLEAGLSSRMIADVAGEPGALPLLADTLDILWQRRAGSVLTQAAYLEVGGVTGALRGRTEALIGKLDEADQATVRRLLVRLVNFGGDAGQGTRRRIPLRKVRPEPLPESERFERIVRLLVEERLLVLDGEGAGQTVEIAHEALIRGWQRLHDWVEEDKQMLVELEKLEALVEQWKEHKTLLSGGQLAYASFVATQHPTEISAEATRLLAASKRRAAWSRRGLQLFALSNVGLMFFFASLWWTARQSQLKLRYAQSTIVPTVKQRSAQGSPEMLLILAKIQLGVEELPAEALATIEQARAAAPRDQDIMTAWVALLLVNKRLTEVLAAAPQVYAALEQPEPRVVVAAAAWAAAYLNDEVIAQTRWAAALLESYPLVRDGTMPLALDSGAVPSITGKYVFIEPKQALAFARVGRLFLLLLRPKSAETTAELMAFFR